MVRVGNNYFAVRVRVPAGCCGSSDDPETCLFRCVYNTVRQFHSDHARYSPASSHLFKGEYPWNKERDKKNILMFRAMIYRYVVVHCFFTVIQPVRYLRCLSFSEYIILDIHLEQTIR